jgi:DNA-dependent RNA polymerase auxiliary subunit epsilon
MKKFTFWRNCIVAETFEVEAGDEEEAREMVRDANPVHEEWIDWLSDDFELENVEELDPLYKMVKDYKLVDSLAK